MTIAQSVLAFLVAYAPPGAHDFTHVPRAETMGRYAAIAEDIAAASTEAPLFAEGEPLRTAILLASIAVFESGGLRADIDACDASGDHGQAWSLWQLHQPKAVVCGTRRNAARAALDAVRQSLKDCAVLPQPERLAEYTSGSCGAGRAASRHRWYRASKFLDRNPSP